MLKKGLITLGILIITGLATGQSPLPPALYVDAESLAAALVESAGERPNMAVGRIANSDDYRINVIHRTAAAGAIVHDTGTELHYITAGSGTLVTGGVVNRPADGGRRTIEGGLARQVKVGDAILIPEGTPHWYSQVPQSITYLEVRF